MNYEWRERTFIFPKDTISSQEKSIPAGLLVLGPMTFLSRSQPSRKKRHNRTLDIRQIILNLWIISGREPHDKRDNELELDQAVERQVNFGVLVVAICAVFATLGQFTRNRCGGYN